MEVFFVWNALDEIVQVDGGGLRDVEVPKLIIFRGIKGKQIFEGKLLSGIGTRSDVVDVQIIFQGAAEETLNDIVKWKNGTLMQLMELDEEEEVP